MDRNMINAYRILKHTHAFHYLIWFLKLPIGETGKIVPLCPFSQMKKLRLKKTEVATLPWDNTASQAGRAPEIQRRTLLCAQLLRHRRGPRECRVTLTEGLFSAPFKRIAYWSGLCPFPKPALWKQMQIYLMLCFQFWTKPEIKGHLTKPFVLLFSKI